MVRTLLVRGLLLGLLAGLVAGVFAFTAGEPRIDEAIALENAAAHEHEHGGAVHEHGAGAAHEHGEEVSRGTQKAGLFLATGLYGLAAGGVFALVFAALRGVSARGRTAGSRSPPPGPPSPPSSSSRSSSTRRTRRRWATRKRSTAGPCCTWR